MNKDYIDSKILNSISSYSNLKMENNISMNVKSPDHINSISNYSKNVPYSCQGKVGTAFKINNTNNNSNFNKSTIKSTTNKNDNFKNISPCYINKESKVTMNYNINMASNLHGNEQNPTLEEILNKQDFSNMITTRLNFIKKKIGEDKLKNILRYLDRNKGQLTEDEIIAKIISIIGKTEYNLIQKNIHIILKDYNYKFKANLNK